MNRLLLYLMWTVVGGGAIGYAFYRQHCVQTHLNVQLQEMQRLLLDDNDDAAKAAEMAVRSLAVPVVKNQNQPWETAVLAAAQNLDLHADSVAKALSTCAEQLLVATRNVTSQPNLPHPGETRTVGHLLGHGTRSQRNLQQQLAGYAATLRALTPTATATFSLSKPNFDGLPVVAALAHLTQLESELRTAEISVLGQLSTRVGAARLKTHLVAFATAESAYVVPGALYKARLRLATALGLPHARMQMRANGRPVPVDSNFVGRVQFVAPSRRGPNTWTGTIRFHIGSRDTTFRIRVPYQVTHP